MSGESGKRRHTSVRKWPERERLKPVLLVHSDSPSFHPLSYPTTTPSHFAESSICPPEAHPIAAKGKEMIQEDLSFLLAEVMVLVVGASRMTQQVSIGMASMAPNGPNPLLIHSG